MPRARHVPVGRFERHRSRHSARTCGTETPGAWSQPLLRRAFERDDGQVSLAVMEFDAQCESIARLSGDKSRRSGAGGTARPALPRFNAWSPVGRSQPKVNLVRRSSVKRCMRPEHAQVGNRCGLTGIRRLSPPHAYVELHAYTLRPRGIAGDEGRRPAGSPCLPVSTVA